MLNLPTDLPTVSTFYVSPIVTFTEGINNTKFTEFRNHCLVAKHPVFEDPDMMKSRYVSVYESM